MLLLLFCWEFHLLYTNLWGQALRWSFQLFFSSELATKITCPDFSAHLILVTEHFWYWLAHLKCENWLMSWPLKIFIHRKSLIGLKIISRKVRGVSLIAKIKESVSEISFADTKSSAEKRASIESSIITKKDPEIWHQLAGNLNKSSYSKGCEYRMLLTSNPAS